MQVVKRDGSLQEFDAGKIVSAISKAFDACGYTISEDVCDKNIIDKKKRKQEKAQKKATFEKFVSGQKQK